MAFELALHFLQMASTPRIYSVIILHKSHNCQHIDNSQESSVNIPVSLNNCILLLKIRSCISINTLPPIRRLSEARNNLL